MGTIDSDSHDYKSVLASVDSRGRRKWVEARLVWGRWRWMRFALSLGLIAFYCAIPFGRIDGHPALQIDIANRHFYLAGVAFWPQDLSYFVILVLLGIVGTLLTVSVLGRVFCGWFCPHNVFLEMVFRPLEELIRGKPGSARRRQKGLAGVTWLAYAAVSYGLANAGTAIFVGADAFRGYLVLDVANHPYAAVFWAILFACIMFNFGWFREQTCTIVCPYGRFQSAMLDPHTLVVAYDAARGEPRGHRSLKDDPGTSLGDCVDCSMCVRVCPTAIDIRNGNQLECIHCTACIDACDDVMARLGKPGGLVRYASEVQLAGQRRRIIRPRTILYGIVCVALVVLLAYRLHTRTPLLVVPLRQTALPVLEHDPQGRDCVRAVLPLSLVNRGDEPLRVSIALDAAEEALVITPTPVIEIPGGARITAMPIVYIPRVHFAAGTHRDVTIRIQSADGPLLGQADVGIRCP